MVIDLVKKHAEAFKYFYKHLSDNKITLQADHYLDKTPYVGSSVVEAKEGFYVKSVYYQDWSEEEKNKIKGLFPIHFREYTFKLASISDTDYDEDRLWEPTISFFVHKNEKSIIKQ